MCIELQRPKCTTHLGLLQPACHTLVVPGGQGLLLRSAVLPMAARTEQLPLLCSSLAWGLPTYHQSVGCRTKPTWNLAKMYGLDLPFQFFVTNTCAVVSQPWQRVMKQ
jgi:hypothetical protein